MADVLGVTDEPNVSGGVDAISEQTVAPDGEQEMLKGRNSMSEDTIICACEEMR